MATLSWRPTQSRRIEASPAEVPAPALTVICPEGKLTPELLRLAAELGARLKVRPRLLATHTVPLAFDVQRSDVSAEWLEEHMRRQVEDMSGEADIRVLLCRDAGDALLKTLAPRSLVLLGTRRHFWRTREERLAARLRRAGHETLLVFA